MDVDTYIQLLKFQKKFYPGGVGAHPPKVGKNLYCVIPHFERLGWTIETINPQNNFLHPYQSSDPEGKWQKISLLNPLTFLP